jgi:hypothetical protein
MRRCPRRRAAQSGPLAHAHRKTLGTPASFCKGRSTTSVSTGARSVAPRSQRFIEGDGRASGSAATAARAARSDDGAQSSQVRCARGLRASSCTVCAPTPPTLDPTLERFSLSVTRRFVLATSARERPIYNANRRLFGVYQSQLRTSSSYSLCMGAIGFY